MRIITCDPHLMGHTVTSVRDIMFKRNDSDADNCRISTVEYRSRQLHDGFSLLEIIIVLSIGLILAAISIPNLNTYFHNSKLRPAGVDFAGLLVQVRFRAVQDSRYYSLYFLAGNSHRAFADIYPQNASGTSGSGGLTIDPKD